LATDERGGSLEGGVHGGVTRPEGNDGEGRRPVVEVDSSRLGKVVGTRAVVGAASTERICGQRRLEQAIHGDSVRPRRNGGGGAEEQPRAPTRRSGELSASVRSSRR
jgi:hypothetical protein